MTNRIVGVKEVREDFRKELVKAANVSPEAKKTKRVAGGSGAQMCVGKAVEVLTSQLSKYESAGRTLDKSMIDLLTPRGARRYASQQLNGLARVALIRGANAVETVYRTLGELVVTGRNGRENVYLAKESITGIELLAVIGLRDGKMAASAARNEELVRELRKGVPFLTDRNLGDAYAQDVSQVFQSVKKAA